jgi:Fe2+ or Zn2+ uptake regulation protein
LHKKISMTYKQTALNTLKTHNYKITPQRMTVLDILTKSKKPLNPYDIAKLSDNTIDVATVYRTMQLFERL